MRIEPYVMGGPAATWWDGNASGIEVPGVYEVAALPLGYCTPERDPRFGLAALKALAIHLGRLDWVMLMQTEEFYQAVSYLQSFDLYRARMARTALPSMAAVKYGARNGPRAGSIHYVQYQSWARRRAAIQRCKTTVRQTVYQDGVYVGPQVSQLLIEWEPFSQHRHSLGVSPYWEWEETPGRKLQRTIVRYKRGRLRDTYHRPNRIHRAEFYAYKWRGELMPSGGYAGPKTCKRRRHYGCNKSRRSYTPHRDRKGTSNPAYWNRAHTAGHQILIPEHPEQPGWFATSEGVEITYQQKWRFYFTYHNSSAVVNGG